MSRYPGRRGASLLLCWLAITLHHANAFSWRLFAGREECIAEYIVDQQWKYALEHEADIDQINVFIDFAFLVTTKHGTEESKAAVDYAVYDAKQQMLRHENGVSEAEVGLSHKGGRGPWRICFRVSSGALLRPSVMVKMSYFSVHYEDYAGEFDWENENPDFHAKHLDAAALGSKEQIEDLEHGLLRLDHYLQNVTAEQRHLYGRTLRHLKTAESTLRRTFWYYLAIYCVICAASFSQLFVVRMMFKKSRKQGLII